MKKPNGYWTYEKCKEEALKYKDRSEFKIKSGTAYNKASKNNWINKICSHMIEHQKPKGYWTIEKCHEEALKYTTKIDFRNNNLPAYNAAYKHKWFDKICSHMIIKKVFPKNYWTKELCQLEAKKYQYRYEFQKKSIGAYKSAFNNSWLDEICSHMVSAGNIMKRCIYVYEFSDNSAYIGLTYNINNRHNKHINDKKSSVYRKLSENINYNLIQLTDYINIEESRILEKFHIERYKTNNWNILNIAKAGSVGGCIKKVYDYIKKTNK